MSTTQAPRSGHCVKGAHGPCAHTAAGVDVGRLRRRRPEAEHVLTVCVCDCHAGCPLAGQGTVTRHLWNQKCTCPGAEAAKERRALTMERRAEVTEVLAGVQRGGGGHLPAREVESRLRSVYSRHGESPPPGVAGWAEVVAAGNARRGTRVPRLLWMGIRAIAGTVRWAWAPAGGIQGHNRAEARRLHGAVAVLALLAALSTAAATRSSRWRGLPMGAGAAAAWLITVLTTSIGTAVVQFARLAERSPEADPRTERSDDPLV